MPGPKPFSQACENNKQPILDVLERYLADNRHVLEVGSGTGQHAVFFGARLPHLVWQTSDLPHCHAGIRCWLEEAGLPNVRPPLSLDVTDPVWPVATTGAVFSANTAHIMSWSMVVSLIGGAGRILHPGGWFLLYGPFSYAGMHTSESNARFDVALRARDPASGIRDFEAIDAQAAKAGLILVEDHAMPANNRLLVWRNAKEAGAPG